MRVPLSWLQDFVEVTLPVDDLVHRLTMAGLEVGDVEYIGAEWQPDKLFVGEVIEVAPHPNADRLVLATVAYGQDQPQTVVTGAPNLRPGDRGQKVAFAVEGAELIDAYSETPDTIVLKRAKIRGVESAGMVCSEKELGLSDDHESILILDAAAEIGQPLQDYMGDIVLDIELTPNLARANNIVGMAREVAALTGQPLRQWPPQDTLLAGPYAEKTSYTAVSSADPQLCARYSAALIENVTIQPSPAWMQRRLRLAGMRPINNIVDITNYCMLETGQPLHAFDYEKLQVSQSGIVVRQAKPGERLLTLDDIDRELTPDMLLITDDSGPIALAGVMGGAATEVSETTRHILLESANFDFLSIRRTSQQLRLYSEAGQRFGRGMDPELTPLGLLRAGRLMESLGEGTLHSDIADTYPNRPDAKHISLPLGDVKRLLGIDVGLDETVRMLTALEFDCTVKQSQGEATTVEVDVPSYRLDVSIPADLIEEIARVHGYDEIPSTLMRDVLPPQRSQPQRQGMEQTRDILAGCGLTEIIAYSLTNLDLINQLNPDQPEANRDDYVRVANPLSSEREFLRQSLLPSMIETLQSNSRFRQRMLLFEIGRAYLPQPGEQLPDEPHRLAIGLTGTVHPASWQTQPDDAAHLGFTHLKGVVETLVGRLNAPELRYEPASHPALHPARTAVLSMNGVQIGIMGEMHPQLRESFELPDQPVALLELDLDALLANRQPRHFTPIARFPAVLEDIALVLDADVPASALQDTIEAAGGELLRHVELFDLYQGDSIPEGKKSLAYALTFQADDRSLTEDEVRTIYQRIQQQAATELGAQPRQ